MKKYFIFFILFYLFSTTAIHAEVFNTTGFIPGQIWYSKDPLVEGDTVKIFTAIWNNGASPLTVKIEFYDKNVILGTRDVVVPALKLQDVSISWKVTSGDHSISAKIISPSITTSGKKEAVSLDRNLTIPDRKFVPVLIKTATGTPASSSDIIKSQIDKASTSLDGAIPNSITEPVSENLGFVDDFRNKTFDKISEAKNEAQNKIETIIKNEAKVATKNLVTSVVDNKKGIEKATVSNTSTNKVSVFDATEKPITYLKLFFLAVLSFIFGSKLIFYSLIVIIMFFVLRSVYFKIRNK